MRCLSCLVVLSVLTGCASRGPTPERELFRLQTAELAEGASERFASSASPSASPPAFAAVPAAPHGLAYTTSVRLVRPDGTLLTAPSLTAFAGQRANISIVKQTAYVEDFDVERVEGAFVADPIIGVVPEGLWIDLIVLPVPGRADHAAVGLRVTSTGLRAPIGDRQVEIGAAAPVTIQFPHTEEVSVAGAQRVRLGQEAEWARVPDPNGGADLRVLGRADATSLDFLDGGPDDVEPSAGTVFLGGEPRSADAIEPTPEVDAEAETLAGLARAAAAGAQQFVLRIDAVRLPRDTSDVDGAGARRLGGVSVRTVRGAGVRSSDRLSEAYVADWELGDAMRAAPPGDPVIGTAVSGIAVEAGADGALHMQWTTLAAWDWFQTTLAQGPPLVIDLPVSSTATRTAPAAPGRTVHPMFTLPDGGTAALVVEWTSADDQPR